MSVENEVNQTQDQSELVSEEAVTTPEQQASQEQAVEEESKPKPQTEVPKWVDRRFSELTRKRYEAQARADVAEAELARLRAGGTETNQPSGQIDPNEVKSLVEKEASRIVEQRTFDERCNKAVELGQKEFKDTFEPALRNLGAMGALFEADGSATELSKLITDSDVPHKLLHHLGSNPEEAENILNLPPRQQARAIGALEARLSTQTPATKPVSNAPEPIKPIGAKGGQPKALEDLPVGDFIKHRNAEIAKRSRSR